MVFIYAIWAFFRAQLRLPPEQSPQTYAVSSILAIMVLSGFGGQSHTVMPMPEILNAFSRAQPESLVQISIDSLIDGCVQEGFNADTAEASADICKDEVSLRLINQIVREESFHSELSWRILEFCFAQDPVLVGSALREEPLKLGGLSHPTATSLQKKKWIEKANPDLLKSYGRLPDSEFDELWINRIRLTQKRLEECIDSAKAST